jgi:hypothetical protein
MMIALGAGGVSDHGDPVLSSKGCGNRYIDFNPRPGLDGFLVRVSGGSVKTSAADAFGHFTLDVVRNIT